MTPRERGQRWRRRQERARGKPRLGRPPGSRNSKSSLTLVRELFVFLFKQGYSQDEVARRVRAEFGVEVTELMVRVWKEIGYL